MSETVIRVENLGKRYILSHRQEGHGKYRALRDVIADGIKSLGSVIQNPKPKILNDREEFWALQSVSFEIKQGDRVGIIGRNGAGKSTLLKVLSRITEPTTGKISIKGRVASLLEVGTGFHPELTGRENIYLNGAILGMSRLEIKRKFDEIVAFAEVEKFLDTPVKKYSSGMYVRLAFAVAAHLEPEILVVDEVLAVGDISFQDKCLGKMQDVSSSGRTVIFVSHNMESIRRLCSTGIFLNSGKVKQINTIENVIDTYLNQFNYQTEDNIIIFPQKENADYFIQKIELLDIDGRPKNKIHTWDKVRFRIYFYSHCHLKGGSVVLQISTLSGTAITLCSTQPDSRVHVDFKQGINQIDCIFPNIILSAGKYLIGAGLAIPNAEWLYKELEYGILTVLPKDVFASGLSPISSRYLIPQEHIWEVEK
jgi:lipopolysaccharide transport system ATP-binding protein